MAMKKITIATRNSPMARWQAEYIKAQILAFNPKLQINLLGITTAGDQSQSSNTPLTDVGGKTLFVKELQQALLDGRADLAVHCVKDMSVEPVPSLMLAAIYKRDDPRDAFISNNFQSVAELPEGACIGTCSPRRIALLKAMRPDLRPKTLRGNAETRLKKLDGGLYDAIILSAAGLHRLGLSHRIAALFDPEQFIPAIGQGALGIECRCSDLPLQELLQPLNDVPSQLCIAAERAVNHRLCGDCHTPIGAYARIDGPSLRLKAVVGDFDGNLLFSEAIGPCENAQLIGINVANDLLAKGANDML